MSHQEKQRIFDQYAKSQGYADWHSLQVFTMIKFQDSTKLQNHIFAACDLVQKEQQTRIAGSVKNVEIAESIMHEYADEIGMMDEEEYVKARKNMIKKGNKFLKTVKSIINPENLIK
ncbi:UNVERIFIED_CONTAM: hypothetical protein POZ17_19860 [Ralstonia mannitolilytica]